MHVSCCRDVGSGGRHNFHYTHVACIRPLYEVVAHVGDLVANFLVENFSYLDRRQVEEPGRSRCRGRRRRSDRREGHRWPILEQAQAARSLMEEEHGSSLRQRRAGAVELDVGCVDIEIHSCERGHHTIVLLRAQTNSDQERFQ